MHSKTTNMYGKLMSAVRDRFDLIHSIKAIPNPSEDDLEKVGTELRKIIEGIGFASIIAYDNGHKNVPKDVKGQWNVRNIIYRLEKGDRLALPSPSNIRKATQEESKDAEIVVEGVPSFRLSTTEIIEIYERAHKWAHEENPYADKKRSDPKQIDLLWEDVDKAYNFLERHSISINGHGFYCTLKDRLDGDVKILPLSKTI